MDSLRRFISAHIHIPGLKAANDIVASLTGIGRMLFFVFAGLLLVSSLALVTMASKNFLVSVPAPGGSLAEGDVGAPRFINPLLALSEADRDLVALVYSGLLRATPDGTFIPDLASSYSISEDGRTYTFTLRDDVTFHDGEPIDADDVVFTIALAQDPAVKSPKRANWDGVTVEKISDKEVAFTLRSPYAPFISNATLGVLPEHLWKNVSAEEFPFSNLNTEAIGSGPYEIRSVARNASGIPDTYTLSPFKHYALGKPYLSSLVLRFYENEEELVAALVRGDIEAANGITPANLSELPAGISVRRAPLNRVFGIFFNQNQSEVLRNAEVRQALSNAIDRESLVSEVLDGYATPINEPLPPGIAPSETISTDLATTSPASAARAYLEARGWKYSEEEGALTKTKGKVTEVLRFTIATADIPELRAAAEFARAAWKQAGADVEVRIFEQGDLNQNVIRPRKYDALLFGEIIGRELDLFAFWHSSQRNDPGLNIALYANASADTFLEELRVAQTMVQRRTLYEKFRAELSEDVPAVFLYAPDFTYAFPDRIKGMNLTAISQPSERFLDVYRWHREEDLVWTFLTRFVQ